VLQSVKSLMCINSAVGPVSVRNGSRGPSDSHNFLAVNLSCQRQAPPLPRPLSATYASRLITEHRTHLALLSHYSLPPTQYLSNLIHCMSVSFVNECSYKQIQKLSLRLSVVSTTRNMMCRLSLSPSLGTWRALIDS
jgi:hypothetical protein